MASLSMNISFRFEGGLCPIKPTEMSLVPAPFYLDNSQLSFILRKAIELLADIMGWSGNHRKEKPVSNNHAISKLDDLITTLIDSVKGYEHSADKVKSVEFQTLFRDLAAERSKAVDLLQARSLALGGQPNTFGSAAGTVHRRIEDIFVALGGGDKAVIQAIDRGEDYLREEFERVLKDEAMDAETNAVVRQAHESVSHGHVVVNSLKDQLANA